MGHARARPRHLAKKLLQIRLSFGLSQSQIAKRIGVQEYSTISKYELDKNEPPLSILLAYAKVAGISTDLLIDDNVGVDALAFGLSHKSAPVARRLGNVGGTFLFSFTEEATIHLPA